MRITDVSKIRQQFHQPKGELPHALRAEQAFVRLRAEIAYVECQKIEPPFPVILINHVVETGYPGNLPGIDVVSDIIHDRVRKCRADGTGNILPGQFGPYMVRGSGIRFNGE